MITKNCFNWLQSLRALAIGDEDEISTIPRIPSIIRTGRAPKPKNIIAAPKRQNDNPMMNVVMNIHFDLVGPFMGPSLCMKKYRGLLR